jgi:hypothetical protein
LQQIAARGDDVENKQNKIDLNPAHPKALSFGQWALALSLKERAELIGRSRFADKPLLQNFNRAERWQRTPAFQTPSNWTHFLGAAGLSEAILENTLSARAELLQDHSSAPDWVTEITASCEEVGDEHSTIDLSDTAGFLRLVEPILKQYTECLADAVRVFNSDFAGEVIDRRVVSDLADNLREQLLAVIARPLKSILPGYKTAWRERTRMSVISTLCESSVSHPFGCISGICTPLWRVIVSNSAPSGSMRQKSFYLD